MTSEKFLLCQQMWVWEKVTLLPNGISINFAKIMLCLRDITNLAEIFERW